MSWPNNRSEFGENRTPVLIGVSVSDGKTIVPVAVDPATGAVITESGGSGNSVNLTEVGGAAISLGQKTEANSLPVTLASDTGTLPVSISGNQAVNLAQVGGASVALGQATMANSLPVVLASNQPTINSSIVLNGSNAPLDDTTFYGDGLTTGIAAVGGRLYNGSSYDRMKSIATGIQGVGVNDGTNTANVLAATSASNASSSQGAELVAGAFKEVIFTTATAQAVGTTDVGNYKWVAVHIVTVGTNAVTNFQCSNDNTNWVSCLLGDVTSTTNWSGGNGTATGLRSGPLQARYFRLNVTGISAGTTSGVIEFYTQAPQANSIINPSVGSNTATGSAVPANAFYMGLNDGTNMVGFKDYIAALAGTGLGIGAIAIVGGLMPIGTALNTYSIHLTTNATTTPTASTAYISSISISNEVGGTTSTVTIQDKQGTPLKLVNGLATTALTTAPTVVNFQTPVKMVSGIDIITAGAVAATVDVWINYYQ